MNYVTIIVPSQSCLFSFLHNPYYVAILNLKDFSFNFICFIACCYGVAKFIVQNKLPTVLWLGSRVLLQVTISGVDWQNTIEFLVGREVLQVFLVGVKFRLVGRTVQNPCRTLNMRHPVHSCTKSVLRAMFSKLGNLNTRD